LSIFENRIVLEFVTPEANFSGIDDYEQTVMNEMGTVALSTSSTPHLSSSTTPIVRHRMKVILQTLAKTLISMWSSSIVRLFWLILSHNSLGVSHQKRHC
jgi:hypothetical protein